MGKRSARTVISNSGFYTEDISAFSEFHLKSIVAKVNSNIKDTDDFLRKLPNLLKLPDELILCTADLVGLYPSTPNEEGLILVKKELDKRRNKIVSTESLIELAELVSKMTTSNLMIGSKNRKRVLLQELICFPLCHYFHDCLRGENF